MVAVGVLALLLTAASYIFNQARTTSSLGTAQNDVLQHAQAIETQLRRDLASVSRDGFMVVKTRRGDVDSDGTDEWRDQLLFFSTAANTGARLDQSLGAAVSRVWYGHLDTNVNGTADEAPTGQPERWMLGRSLALLNPNSGFVPNSIFPGYSTTGVDITSNQRDIVETDMLQMRSQLTASAAPNDPLLACFRPEAARYPDKDELQEADWSDYSDPDTVEAINELMAIHPILAGNCGNFRVEFALDVDGDGDLDPAGAANTDWYGSNDAPDVGTGTYEVPADTVSGSSGSYEYTFGYDDNEALPWPAALRISLNLHDAGGELAQLHDRDANQPDGRGYTFVIDLRE